MKKTAIYTLLGALVFALASPVRAGADEATEFYLSRISSLAAGRPLTAAERTLIRQEERKAIPQIIKAWLQQSYFEKVARSYVEQLLRTSGTRSGSDWNLPGNLAQYMVRNNLPYSTLLTANYCINQNLQVVACDSGAPYTAGVLTTRAYLQSHSSRFNLNRGGSLIRSFACRSYPMPTDLQPRAERARLIPMFQHDNPSNPPPGGLSNGVACYTCHSQFAQHAQLFVKFNRDGIYDPQATGLQAPGGEPGASLNGTFASHFTEAYAADESSDMLGTKVANLAEAAAVLAKSEAFSECSSMNVLKYFLKMSASDEAIIPWVNLRTFGKELSKQYGQPTFQQIVEYVLAHPLTVQSVLDSSGITRRSP